MLRPRWPSRPLQPLRRRAAGEGARAVEADTRVASITGTVAGVAANMVTAAGVAASTGTEAEAAGMGLAVGAPREGHARGARAGDAASTATAGIAATPHSDMFRKANKRCEAYPKNISLALSVVLDNYWL